MLKFPSHHGAVAQLVARLVRNEKVRGSNPLSSTRPEPRPTSKNIAGGAGPASSPGSTLRERWNARRALQGRYDTDIDDLWSALTDAQRLARWIAEVEGDLLLGGEFRATFTSGWEGRGRVDVCEPPRRLLVTMAPGRENETVIEAELVAYGDQTRLVLEERGLPLEVLAGHGAGWQAHVEDLAIH